MTLVDDYNAEPKVNGEGYCFGHVVMQPTTLCNLNCSYCYLPERQQLHRMSREIAKAVAKSISRTPHPITLVWHGGEPLSIGRKYLEELVDEFQDLHRKGIVSHNVQTNGTLIDQNWCDFFKANRFSIGVSLDGDSVHNSNRLTWGNASSHSKVMQGIEMLKKNDLDFGVIAVVSSANLDSPEELYSFFCGLGPDSLNINIEEKEGLNRLGSTFEADRVKSFWSRLFAAWRQNPIIKIREIDRTLGWMQSVCGNAGEAKPYTRDFWPTVAYNGDVVVLSPEFMAVNENEKSNFVVGNVSNTSLPDLITRSMNLPYVQQFFSSLTKCSASCAYYSFCGGGEASNKYFENNDITSTETSHCRNTRQYVVDAVLESLTKGEKMYATRNAN